MDQDDVPDSASQSDDSGVHTLTLPVLRHANVTFSHFVEDLVALNPARTNGRGASGARRDGHGSTSRTHATPGNGHGSAPGNHGTPGNGHGSAARTHATQNGCGLAISPHFMRFRKRFFPGTTAAEWNDWRWQVRSRIKDLEGLSRVVHLSDDEREAVRRLGGQLPVGITPYYAGLMDLDNPMQGIRRTVIPVTAELTQGPGEFDDPLAEDGHSPVPGLVHRYPDRVLFLVTSFCATYCRYCTRSRMVGQTGEYHFNTRQYEQAIGYIEAHPQIRDVLLSGGDPLALGDDRLEWLLSRLRRIPHVEFLRIGTKVPAVLPQRITSSLVRMLRRYHPLWMSIHFMHPDELTAEVGQACARLADAGIPLGSQTVLCQGVNDDVETMKRLMHGLLRFRVRPYYLYQCDPIAGSSHFRTPVEKGLEIIRGLRGHTTGYAVPNFVIDAPGGGGKIPLMPEYFAGRDGDDVLLRNYEDQIFRYYDPVGATSAECPPHHGGSSTRRVNSVRSAE